MPPRPGADRRQLNPWALLSILASTFVLCPLTTIAGPLLGVKALGDIRTDPSQRGSALAKWGIIIGSLVTVVWIAGAVWWNANVRQPVIAGPHDALVAGSAGDLDGFRAGFCCQAAEASREETIVFLAEMQRRYGRFVSIHLAADVDPASFGESEGPGVRRRIPYVLEFSDATVHATADFVVGGGEGQGLQLKFSRLQILDDNLGDITYPQDSSGEQGDAAPAAGPSGAAERDGSL